MFIWEVKWTQAGMRFHFGQNFTLAFSQLFTCVHMNWCKMKLKTVWISYWSFRQKWNFISGDKISCKHYLKLNAYTCPSKYWVILKCSQNETSCEQNLFSHQFKISNRYEFISPLMWTYSYTPFWVTIWVISREVKVLMVLLEDKIRIIVQHSTFQWFVWIAL